MSVPRLSRLFTAFVLIVFPTSRLLLADDQQWGAVKGRIVLDAPAAPDPKVIDVGNNTDQKHCLSKGPLLSDQLVVNKANMGVRWVYVWLTPVGDPRARLPVPKDLAQPTKKEVELDQPCCAFVPHALAIREGQEILVKNSSPVTHNINWTGFTKNPGGNTVVPSQKTYTIKGLQADRFPVQLSCNVHGWMKGWVRIFDHPYFALTDADGKFEIDKAPSGPVSLIVWHESGWGPGGRDGTPIEIKSGGAVDLGDLKMQPPK